MSIVICTHNRANLARDAIRSVLNQDFPQSDYELLIIDNASTDGTFDMAQEFCSKYPHVRYFLETNVGLSYARNRGWQEACGEYVGYLDDDGKASPGWLSTARDIGTNLRPEVFGGPYYAFYNSPKPAWYKDEYGSHVQGNDPRVLMENEYLDGGNVFFRRTVLQNLDGFNPQLGMKGKEIAFGEETYFFIRLRALIPGARLYYHPDVCIQHLVREEKFSIRDILVRRFWSGVSFRMIQIGKRPPHLLKNLIKAFFSLARLVIALTWGIITRDKNLHPFFQNFVVEVAAAHAFVLGIEFQSIKEMF